MFNKNWKINVTAKHRYEDTGVDDFIINYLCENKLKAPKIFDVGCSTGIALKTTCEKLRKRGFNPSIIGCDVAKSVKRKAEKNLHKFINDDILNVNEYAKHADIIICSKMAIFIHGTRRYDIITKCSQILKETGILITDVDCYKARTFKQNLRRVLRHFWYQIPSLSILNHGIKNIFREYSKRANTTIREDVFQLSYCEISSYSRKIILGWNSRSKLWKLWWNFVIFRF